MAMPHLDFAMPSSCSPALVLRSVRQNNLISRADLAVALSHVTHLRTHVETASLVAGCDRLGDLSARTGTSTPLDTARSAGPPYGSCW